MNLRRIEEVTGKDLRRLERYHEAGRVLRAAD